MILNSFIFAFLLNLKHNESSQQESDIEVNPAEEADVDVAAKILF